MKYICRPLSMGIALALPEFLLGVYWFCAWEKYGYLELPLNRIIGSLLIGSAAGISYYLYKQKNKMLSFKALVILGILLSCINITMIYSMFISGFLGINTGSIYFIVGNIVGFSFQMIYLLVAMTSKVTKKRRLLPYVGSLIVYPFITYMGILMLREMSWLLSNRLGHNSITEILWILFIVAAVYSLSCLIIQVIVVLKKDKGFAFFPSKGEDGKLPVRYYISTTVILIILPLIGLSVNKYFGTDFFGEGYGIIANFSHSAFWVLVVFNGLICLVPPLKNSSLRNIIFYLKIVGYSYIVYFFLAFLPVLPLGFLGILLMGLGLLTFIPTLATVWEGYYLFKEAKELMVQKGKRIVGYISFLGILTLPCIFAVSVLGDRMQLKTALQYVEGTNLQGVVNHNQLRRIIDKLDETYTDSWDELPLYGKNTPILSPIYRKWVVGREGMQPYQLEYIRKLFFEEKISEAGGNEGVRGKGDEHVVLGEVYVETTYDEKDEVYHSWIHMNLKNTKEITASEYGTYFKLPKEVFISDYYLYVGEEIKYGILADERAAMTVYNRIVSQGRDPGVLRYVDERQLELRVFPFGAMEERKTGFEILHKESFDFTLDNIKIVVDVEKELLEETIMELGTTGITYLSSAFIDTLPSMERRKPHYYFLIDSSKRGYREDFVKQVEDYIRKNHLEKVTTVLVDEGVNVLTEELIDATKKGGSGYNLNGAMRYLLQREEVDYFPVMIAVSDDLEGGILPYNVDDLVAKYPESSYYYHLTDDLKLRPYGYKSSKVYESGPNIYINPIHKKVDEPLIEGVKIYKGIPVKNTGNDQFILPKMLGELKSTGNRYTDGLILRAVEEYYGQYGNDRLYDLVEVSNKIRLLSSETAFIVLETKEQEKELQRLQESVQMAEPVEIVCIISAVVLVIVGRRFKYRVGQEDVTRREEGI